MSDFNPQYEWLGIPPHEQPADHYRLLGLARFESNPTVIANAADRQLSHLRMFQRGPRGKFTIELIDEVAQAKACLLAPEKKEAYDQSLRAPQSTAPAIQAAPQKVIAPAIEPIIKTIKNSKTIKTVKTSAKSRPKTRKRSSPKSISTVLQIAIGGVVGICLATGILWYGLGMDPLGVFTAGSQSQQKSTQVAIQQSSVEQSNTKSYASRTARNLRRVNPAQSSARMNSSPQREGTAKATSERTTPPTSAGATTSQHPAASTALPENTSATASRENETATNTPSSSGPSNTAPVNDQFADVMERFSEGVRALQSGKAKAAERMFRDCLEDAGEQNLDQIGTLNNLALAYAAQGKASPAFQTWKRALEALKGENAKATAEVVVKNLNQLGFGVRNLKVTGIDAHEVETVAALARQYEVPAEVPGRWLALSHPTGIVPAAISTVNIAYVCLHCEGRKTVRCPVDGCRNGKLLRYTNRDEGGGVVQTVPVNVRCDGCDGKGKVACPSCRQQ